LVAVARFFRFSTLLSASGTDMNLFAALDIFGLEKRHCDSSSNESWTMQKQKIKYDERRDNDMTGSSGDPLASLHWVCVESPDGASKLQINLYPLPREAACYAYHSRADRRDPKGDVARPPLATIIGDDVDNPLDRARGPF
jgi:hypothetical protein